MRVRSQIASRVQCNEFTADRQCERTFGITEALIGDIALAVRTSVVYICLFVTPEFNSVTRIAPQIALMSSYCMSLNTVTACSVQWG